MLESPEFLGQLKRLITQAAITNRHFKKRGVALLDVDEVADVGIEGFEHFGKFGGIFGLKHQRAVIHFRFILLEKSEDGGVIELWFRVSSSLGGCGLRGRSVSRKGV